MVLRNLLLWFYFLFLWATVSAPWAWYVLFSMSLAFDVLCRNVWTKQNDEWWFGSGFFRMTYRFWDIDVQSVHRAWCVCFPVSFIYFPFYQVVWLHTHWGEVVGLQFRIEWTKNKLDGQIRRRDRDAEGVERERERHGERAYIPSVAYHAYTVFDCFRHQHHCKLE